jgi:hypothetical protein
MAGDKQSVSERIRLAERRRQALYLSAVRGLVTAEIATFLGVSERTVERDLRQARQAAMAELQRRAETAELVTDLAVDIDASLSAVARESWAAVAATDAKSPQHTRALNTALAAISRRAEVLQSLGLLKRSPEAVALSFDPLGLSDAEIEHYLQAAKEPRWWSALTPLPIRLTSRGSWPCVRNRARG